MKSVLIVDDNLASLKQIGAQLSGSYEISLAKSGELALQICQQTKPDLIILDVEMPGLDGFEVIAKLKEHQGLKQIPVIFLTGSRDAAIEIKALESGAVDFISKPVNRDILFHRIELHIQFSAYQLHLENTVQELEDSIGVSFAELIECKDDNVAGHVLRTSKYVELLGRELLDANVFGDKLTGDDVDMITRAAPFHDIGKIGISDTILLKRGPLSPEEYGEIKKHTTIGARVLETIYQRIPNQYYFKQAKIIAEGHHERYDGKGYPWGLAGEDIPLCCRILTVANVYDACMTDRIYRKALTHEESSAIIIAGKGTEFDPRIVEVFEAICDKFALLHVQLQLLTKDVGRSLRYEADTDRGR
ncbi:MAG: response regulator [Treponema sp.]|jgi:putative two-component system response regulator|nr:response regulator [Treponema sp.]